MKKHIQLTLILAIAFTCNYTFSQAADADKKSALVFVEDGAGNLLLVEFMHLQLEVLHVMETEILMMPLVTLEIGL